MRKGLLHTAIIIAVLSLFACRKETSIESRTPLAGDFRADINGVQWLAADSARSATILSGLINITGISNDHKQLSITLADTALGVYTLDQASSSVAAYADIDSSDFYAFSTNQGSDTTQAGGRVTVTEIDPVHKTITGTFSFKVYRDLDGHQKVITNGVFYKLPYSNTLPAANGTDTLQARIDGTDWSGKSISAESISGQLAISGSLLDGSQSVSLVMPADITKGTYPLDFTGLTYIGLYSPTPRSLLASTTGTLTILENNTTTQRIRGNFQFTAADPLGLQTTQHKLTNGYFSVSYTP